MNYLDKLFNLEDKFREYWFRWTYAQISRTKYGWLQLVTLDINNKNIILKKY